MAYIDLVQCGEVAVISRILGHMDHVDNGVVYLVFHGVMRGLIEQKRVTGLPKWLMYDTLLGAKEGLRYFKERLGFKPYHVKWLWKQY